MKIYTKTGDKGQTGLFGGQRVSKACDRVDAYGEVDELNSAVGVARATRLPPSADALLATVQSALFDLGAELATPPSRDQKAGAMALPKVSEEDIVALEHAIDAHEAPLPALTSFILPGGSPQAAALHLARCVCRRAERRVVAFADSVHGTEEGPLRPEIVRYLNRLSDLLFTLARHANHVAGVQDVPWVGRGSAE